MERARAKPKQTRFRLRRPLKRQIEWGVALLAAITVGYFAYQAAGQLPGTSVAVWGNDHILSLATPHLPYNSDPPTSGPHLGSIAPWGVHTEPIPKELQVHNLEDGGVLVQYNCPQGCPDLVDKLRSIVSSYTQQVILAPYPRMDRRTALTAWGWIDKFDEFDEQRNVRFIKAYKGIDHHERNFSTN